MSDGSVREDDLELLRRYEPVLRFTAGEMFFPAAVGPYVRRCALWARTRRGERISLAAPGELDLEALAATRPAGPGEAQYLEFVQEPLGGAELLEWKNRERPEFRAPGRLARVGLLARFADGLFTLSLLLRSTVPGGTAAQAARQYRDMLEEHPVYPYYARVVRDARYVVLHYQFFYVMNDWRSSFWGVNDHEADWEQVLVFLEQSEAGELHPAWVAFAAHDSAGPDLRRRWDDPEVTFEGDHPVVFVAAGSHASYFLPGEYVIDVELRILEPLFRAVDGVRRLWRDVLRQGDPREFAARVEAFLRIPFVDYARGDGDSIGPGAQEQWTPEVIDDDVPWVRNYRGLWGIDVQDIFTGELAPAGPRYHRDGSVRETWRDPIGWAGLRSVPPAASEETMLDERAQALRLESAAVVARIEEIDRDLPRLEIERRALGTGAHLRPQREQRDAEITALERERRALGRRRTELVDSLEALESFRTAPPEERRGDPHEHLRRPYRPEPADRARRGRLAEVWAALSTGVLLLGGAALVLLGVDNLAVALVMLIGTVFIVESILHGWFANLLLHAVSALATATALVLIYEFFWQLAFIAVAAIALLILVDNIRELRGR